MESCFYEGVLHHERLTPVKHRFHYRLHLAYLDLAELPALKRCGLIPEDRFGLGSFRRADHFGDPRRRMDDEVLDLVQRETGSRPAGPVRVLTQLSCVGYYFSPLNLFCCFGSDRASMEAIVAEVQNTPWREKHAYVLWQGNREATGVEGVYRHPKAFHVSPFMGMNAEYRWRFRQPGLTFEVGIENFVAGEPVFRAGLFLRRLPLTKSNRRRLLVRYPLSPFRITAAIYWQAFQLWRKRCPFYPHPKQPSPSTSSPAFVSPDRISGNESLATASQAD